MRKVFKMKFVSVIKNDFKNILSKDSLRFGLKCGALSGIFAAIWLYGEVPMGFWAVYSAYIVMQNNTGSTLKKGIQRISGHILIAIFSYLYAIAFINGYLILSIIPVIVGYFVLGYLVAGSDHIRYAGISGGIGFGIMLFEYPLNKLTLHVIYLRTVIIIGSAMAGILFDHFVFPVKTSSIFKGHLQKILISLTTVTNIIQRSDMNSLNEHLIIVNKNIYRASKEITDFAIFQRSRKKYIYLEVFNSLKQIFYNFKKYQLLLEEKDYPIINDQINNNEREIILFIKNKLSEIETLFLVSNFNPDYSENKYIDISNLKEQMNNIRNQNWYIDSTLEQRINIYSRLANLYSIANEVNLCYHIIIKNTKTKDLHKMLQT